MSEALLNLGLALRLAASCYEQRPEDWGRDAKAHIRIPIARAIIRRASDRRIRAAVAPVALPAPRTLCGAPAGSRDYGGADPRHDAQRALDAGGFDLCPAYVAAAGMARSEREIRASKLSARRGTITPRQRNYLAALCREAFAHNYPHPDRIDTLSSADASRYIDQLVTAKRRGWRKED